MKHVRDRLSAHDGLRKLKNVLMIGLLIAATAAAILPLGSVFLQLLEKGLSGLNWNFFLHLPAPVGEVGGGMANAIAGTLILIGIAAVIGIPIGIAAGIFLSEYGTGKFAATLRFVIDLLASTPSIIIGLFAYAVLVVPLRHFSALAGGAALAVIMIPVVARTSEELLKLVPIHVREAGLALGIPRWKVILFVVVRGSVGGLTTGVMLAVARAAGETAPLLFTAFSSQFWPRSLTQPVASLPVQIYTYAISPYDEWHQQAWTGALTLVSLIFALNLLTRLIIRRQPAGRD